MATRTITAGEKETTTPNSTARTTAGEKGTTTLNSTARTTNTRNHRLRILVNVLILLFSFIRNVNADWNIVLPICVR